VARNQIRRGPSPQVSSPLRWLALLAIVATRTSAADPTAPPTEIAPDPPARTPQRVSRPLPPSSDLDGWYVWLGPVGAAGYSSSTWDSTFGGDLSIVRVREQAPLATIGGSIGASRWTLRDEGRVWADAVVGSRLAGHMFGLSAGPLLEVAQLRHAALGGSVGVWGFAGVTPYARVGAVAGIGAFVEIGVHVALPVFRHR
jgi:hypothetical protein